MNTIQKISKIIAAQNNGIINSPNIYVIDYKNINGGGVEVSENEPEHNYVYLSNENNLEVFYISFLENALKVNTPEGQVNQCECVLFPSELNDDDWMLFIETKYANNFQSAFWGKIDHPNKSIKQIISTVEYFREKNILPKDKKVFAIVSFPKLIDDFSEAFFTRSQITIEEILIKHKIMLRPTNSGIIKSTRRIKI